ncbi:rubrerythrin [Oxobacter pfennigii]|uniref:Rubrerythrin n=1 Tax=Oxobacter pfennigii TaxID=36849 RepID=A0A0P8WNY4_9CLOT|nr:ferritin family protein [Oxobacter pfennigii]KPU44268.1 rubrerythrin [Oxobacter pfennigii]
MNSEEYKDILKLAIENEVEAYEFYDYAVSKVKDANLKSIFEKLAEEELRHKKILEGFINNEDKPLRFNRPTNYKISETVETPKFSPDMKFADAIGLAMKKEEETMNMYKSFADISDDDGQKNIFLELSKMEEGHKTRLEDIYTNAAYAEVW